MAGVLTLEQLLSERTTGGKLYEKLPDNRVQCYACGHRCRIPEGKKGICKVRYNEGGELRVPRNYVGAIQVDPIEKKPFFHALPGARALSYGMLGCDYHCDYCQNWITSQALHDPASEEAGAYPQDLTAEGIVQLALQYKCPVVTSTYNEPLITSEWSVEVFQEARKKGLLTSYVSNGNGTKEVLEFIRPYVDLYKVDLKAFNDKHYRSTMGGTLRPVLETIERLKAMGFWLEIVTLVIPGFNDSEKELRATAGFIASVSRDIPWHATAFHSDYKMMATPDTQPGQLRRVYEIGREAGLRFVYSGNRPGQVGTTENTYCPSCDELLVERYGFRVHQVKIGPDGLCPKCKTSIPGVWKIPGREPNPVIPVERTPLAEQALAQAQPEKK
jgi:pyruvate formate lyase activating enzyme